MQFFTVLFIPNNMTRLHKESKVSVIKQGCQEQFFALWVGKKKKENVLVLFPLKGNN